LSEVNLAIGPKGQAVIVVIAEAGQTGDEIANLARPFEHRDFPAV